MYECVEVLRRTVWAVFRIEWEVIAKGHAPEPRYEVELYADDALDTMKVLRVKPENVSL